MAVRYKQLCFKCKKKYVEATWKDRYILCYDCQKAELSIEIKNPKMKKMFNIPESFYEKNSFLRSIKMNYLRYGNLTERQLEAFKKTVAKMKEKT